jgi:hypothetical protein|tara:strand:+ start:513 stop:989 length:477 start_codon:yes stop_codon:yes gene_type:complete
MRDLFRHVELLLNSFSSLVGRDLLVRNRTREEQAHCLFTAPFVVVSHGTEDDPILNYGNEKALCLWGMTWEDFVQTPSRKTAEPIHQNERAQLLERTLKNGYIDDYSGIRVSKTGKRFKIDQAIIWNITDENGHYYGQAATFDTWHYLPPISSVHTNP